MRWLGFYRSERRQSKDTASKENHMTKRPTQRETRAALDWLGVTAGKMTGEEFAEKYGERAKRRQLEDALQRECWNWTQRKKHWWRHFVRHVGTERSSNDERLVQLGKGGLSPGWWDFELWLPSGPCRGLAIELKCLNNELTDWQKERHKSYNSLGWATEVIKDEKIRFVASVEQYLSEMTESQRISWMQYSASLQRRFERVDDWRDK